MTRSAVVAPLRASISALGIATGGIASVMALLSAVGGPITLGIGIAIAVFLGLKALFGDAWQSRLARQIADHFRKSGVEANFKRAISDYWEKTHIAFDKGANAVEEKFVSELQNLGAVLHQPEKQEEAARLVKIYEAVKDFFDGLPWISLRPRLPS